ncbi:peptidase S28 family protein [Thecamonas trahens ATCC 50062]|uniref:Peptidase S28 family protein n=1 Tax=Thecamonas trahens ATCC 50062 TaxID=461836 RepID=A0A0L0DH64_THETB|nr:peptidase S28 family protein [Thecamonas trahens ATCC 50062]KNC51652.1 peptidase S28 family protein [Thecamonas trahens ATCC 50062]|eukprot:XP_013755790.1 peptidase S28 family protein [Thecamonas trahens ATCC 50062]
MSDVCHLREGAVEAAMSEVMAGSADLGREVVRSATASWEVPEIGFRAPAAGQAELTTVERLLRRACVGLSAMQPVRRIQEPEAAARIDEIVDQLEACLRGAMAFTLTIHDPSGASYIGPNSEIEDELAVVAEEVVSMAVECGMCSMPGTVRTIVMQVPHFNETTVSGFVCEGCGYKTNDVRTTATPSRCGRTHTLTVNERSDLGRQVIKTETAGIEVPELGLRLKPGTLGGKVTTVEGLLADVRQQLGAASRSSDDAAPWAAFLARLDACIAGEDELPFTVILDDPTGNSSIEAVADPDPSMLAVAVVYVAVGSEGASPAYTTQWVTQELDHFDFTTRGADGATTFKQRMIFTDKYYDERTGGPIFLYTGNEGDIVSFYNNTGLIFEFAERLGAFVLFIEHRYYGETLPFGADSFTPENIRLCSSEQALADYAHLLVQIQQGKLLGEYKGLDKSEVIAFGGSYGGMLAAWIRVKYPALVKGSLAASAPILEFEGLVDPTAYNAVITRDFADAAPGCADNIRQVYNNVLPEMRTTASGRRAIGDALRTCKPVESQADVDQVFEWSNSAFAYMSMLDYPAPSDFLRPMPGNPVNVSCKYATALPTQPTDAERIAAFGLAAGVYWNGTGDAECFDIYAQLSPNLGNMTPWDFQACTEMVFPITQTGTTDMFWPAPFNLTAYEEACMQQFGVMPRPYWAQTYYGSNNLEAASNIILSNGVLDPWISGGVTKTVSDSVVAIVIEHGAHHLDLRWSDPADPQSVIDARKQEFELISSWLQDVPSVSIA